MEGFHFIHANWLILLILIPVLWGFYWWRRKPQNTFNDVVDKQLAPFVLSGQNTPSYTWAFIWSSLIIWLASLAMAGPAWEKREVPTFRSQQAVVVALDLSRSMYARDVTPSRLDLARFKLLDLLEARRDGQTGLVVFAGDAFVVSPLTQDGETIAAQVKNLGPNIMPVQGSQVSQAILRSTDLLKQAGISKGGILLMLDGLNSVDRAQQAAEQATAAGYSVSALAIGTTSGAPIPLEQGGFVTNERGDTVMAAVDREQIKAVTQVGEGVFVAAQLGDDDINQLMNFWEEALQSNELLKAEEQSFDAWFNEGIWLVLLLLPCFALLFRRGWLPGIVLVLGVNLFSTPELQASFWQDLWQTPDQQGAEAFKQNDLQTARQLFQDLDWKAAAAYRAGDYKTAEKLYSSSKTLRAQYNYGNALAKQGKYEAALAAYEAVLQQDPEHIDARYNYDLLKKQLQNQQKNQQNQQSPSNDSTQNKQGQQDAQQPPPENQSNHGQQAPPANASESQEARNRAHNATATEENQANRAEAESEVSETRNSDSGPQDAQQKEQQQATQQWLRRIPDDPAGLWRRKFYYQYQQRAQPQQGDAW